MAKINFGYESLFDYLRRKIYPFNFIYNKFFAQENRILSFLYSDEYYVLYNMEDPSPAKKRIIGPFQVFLDMGKDIVDTVKLYKGLYQYIRDAAQPAIGALNILKGAASIALSPLVLVGNFILDSVKAVYASVATDKSASSIRRKFARNSIVNLMRTASWIADGITSVIRGATQVIFTPLTWFVKIPLRGIITAIKGTPKIEENPGIQKLLDHSQNSTADLINPSMADADIAKGNVNYRSGGPALIQKALHAKFKCSLSKGQDTNIDPNKEEDIYNNNGSSSIAVYFQLFSNTNKKPTVSDKEDASLLTTSNNLLKQ